MIEEIFIPTADSTESSKEIQGNKSNFPNEGEFQGAPTDTIDETNQEMPGENTLFGEDESITHNGAITFVEDANINGQTYSSDLDNQHAILVTGGSVTISDAIITKSGNAEGDSADFYGTNAAVFTSDGSLELNNVNITTDGTHANAVFAYGNGEGIIITDSTIITKNDNSGGIMVTGGGELTAKNVVVTTNGNSSAAIRSDRGGGNINVEGGSYTTNGIGSPVIYSTADIKVENAQLISTQSEGAIVEGKNSITILNSTLIDSNTTLNGQSKTYKNIFLYQSMSGDADEGTANFTAKDSKIITNNGDTIYVTNTTAKILLENNEITNTNGDFLRIEASNWGKEGQNGGDVSLDLVNQNVEGNIIIDNISHLTMNLTEGSTFTGAINSDNQSKDVSIKLDEDSTWILESDSYISEIQSNTTGYSNINLNGYTLYIGENAITSTDWLSTNETGSTTIELERYEGYSTTDLILGGIGIIAIITAIWVCIRTYTKK